MKAYLIKYGEIGIKGKNRSMFEDTLARQVRQTLAGLGEGYTVSKERGRIYAYCPDDHDEDAVIDAMQHIFGIVGICPVKIYPCTDPETLRKDIPSSTRRTQTKSRWSSAGMMPTAIMRKTLRYR